MEKKITKATVNSFIRKNQGNIYFKLLSYFDGQIDGTTTCSYPLWEHRPNISIINITTYGKNWFCAYEDDVFKGFEISNCCNRVIIAIKKVNLKGIKNV